MHPPLPRFNLPLLSNTPSTLTIFLVVVGIFIHRHKASGAIPSQTQETVNRYPSGKQVLIYYNPTNPQDSALER